MVTDTIMFSLISQLKVVIQYLNNSEFIQMVSLLHFFDMIRLINARINIQSHSMAFSALKDMFKILILRAMLSLFSLY